MIYVVTVRSGIHYATARSETLGQEQGGEALVLDIGERVQALFYEEGTKTWYSGVVVRQDVETG